jgi:hypothetical protein
MSAENSPTWDYFANDVPDHVTDPKHTMLWQAACLLLAANRGKCTDLVDNVNKVGEEKRPDDKAALDALGKRCDAVAP